MHDQGVQISPDPITLESIVRALEWVIGAHPNKRHPYRDRRADLSVIRSLDALEREFDDPDISSERLRHIAHTYASGIVSALDVNHPGRAAYLMLLDPGVPIGEKDLVLREMYYVSDPKSVRAKRAVLLSEIGNLILDDNSMRKYRTALKVPDTTPESIIVNPRIPFRRGSRLVVVVLLIAVMALLVLRERSTGSLGSGALSLSIVPPDCAIDLCNSEQSAMTGITRGFTPGGIVRISIQTPSGRDANDLAGPYSYGTTPSVNRDGTFKWVYWWDPGMELGTYTTTVLDVETGRTVSREFTFSAGVGSPPGKRLNISAQ